MAKTQTNVHLKEDVIKIEHLKPSVHLSDGL